MKAIGVVLCVLLALEAAWCHPASEEDTKILKKCADENKVKYDDMKPLLDEKDVSKDVKCFMKCVAMAIGVLHEDGTIEVDQEFKESGEEEFLAISAACKDIEKNDDLCEMAYQHGICMLKHDTDGKMKEHFKESWEKM